MKKKPTIIITIHNLLAPTAATIGQLIKWLIASAINHLTNTPPPSLPPSEKCLNFYYTLPRSLSVVISNTQLTVFAFDSAFCHRFWSVSSFISFILSEHSRIYAEFSTDLRQTCELNMKQCAKQENEGWRGREGARNECVISFLRYCLPFRFFTAYDYLSSAILNAFAHSVYYVDTIS